MGRILVALLGPLELNYWSREFERMGSLKKRLQVFVSSTYTDLIEERQAAVGAILTAGHIPAGMELFTAGDETQMEVIKRWIDESDVYLLILGSRYGSIEPTTGKSYTHLEYEYAVNSDKSLFACVIDESVEEARVSRLGLDVIERTSPQKLKEFRGVVLDRMVRFWKDTKDIKISIGETMSVLSRRKDLEGWVRARQTADMPALANEITRLSKENASLREQLGSGYSRQQLVRDIYSRGSDVRVRAEAAIQFVKLERSMGHRSSLSQADLSKADLSGTDLSGTDLGGANLGSADLREADLSDTNLSGANLSEADLSEAKLCRANLNRAALSGIDLTKADLNGATLIEAKFNSGKLLKNLADAALQVYASRKLTFNKGASLSEACLRAADLRKADLRAVDLRWADLVGANLSKANLSGANLGKATVTQEQLSSAYGSETTVLPNGMMIPDHWKRAENQ